MEKCAAGEHAAFSYYVSNAGHTQDPVYSAEMPEFANRIRGLRECGIDYSIINDGETSECGTWVNGELVVENKIEGEEAMQKCESLDEDAKEWYTGGPQIQVSSSSFTTQKLGNGDTDCN